MPEITNKYLNDLFADIADESDQSLQICKATTQMRHLSDTDQMESIINLSSIISLLINETGRWCERYASDLIIEWDHIRELIKDGVNFIFDNKQTTESYRKTVAIGIRNSGVDGNSYIYNNMVEKLAISTYYSRIYAVDILVTNLDNMIEITVTLKDIKSGVSHFKHKKKG